MDIYSLLLSLVFEIDDLGLFFDELVPCGRSESE